MARIPIIASIIAIAVVVGPLGSMAQTGGGGAGGGSAGGGTGGTSAGSPSGGSTGAGRAGVTTAPSNPANATASPNPGSAGTGTPGVTRTPSDTGNAGGINNSAINPGGPNNSGTVASEPPPPPGTNSLGTANASGSSVTTGSARNRAQRGGTAATGPQRESDIAIDGENKEIDRKIKSICRGC